MKTPIQQNYRSRNFKISLFICGVFCSLVAKATDPSALTQVPNCSSSDDLIYQPRGRVMSFADLPKVTLLARSANVEAIVMDKNSNNFKIRAHQDFLKPASVVDCLSGDASASDSISFAVPALLDFTSAKMVGNSVWQFNLSFTPATIGIWNQVSHILSHNFKIQSLASSANQQVILSQMSQTQYELFIKQNISGLVKIIYVEFDAISAP